VSIFRISGTRLISGSGTLAECKPMQNPVGLLFALAYTPR